MLALERHTVEPFVVHVAINGSTDGTQAMLAQYAADRPGMLDVLDLGENVGIARARNSHWATCVGHDAFRMDDKIEIRTPYWSQQLRRQATQHRALIVLTDPDTDVLWRRADEQEIAVYPPWQCGAAMWIPGEVSERLGAWDEMIWPDGSPLLYGYEDLAYFARAEAIGWRWAYSLVVKADFLARANPASRARAAAFDPIYQARKAEYLNGERDLLIPVETTEGHRRGGQVTDSALVRSGSAATLAYP